MSKILFSESAWEEYLYWQSQDKKTIKRIHLLIQDICRNHYEGIGKSEKLKYFENRWSRRIAEKNRLVYAINNDTIEILQCKEHYQD